MMIVGKKQNMIPVLKKLMKMWILSNQHHLFILCTWDVFSVNANKMQQLSNNVRRWLNHYFSAGVIVNLLGWKNLKHRQ